MSCAGRQMRRHIALACAVLGLVICSSGAAGAQKSGETPHPPHQGWSLSLGAGALRHADAPRTTGNLRNNPRTDIAMLGALARSLGAKVLFEVGGWLSLARGVGPTPASVQAKARWLWYPAVRRLQRDQIFLVGGVTFISERHRTGGTRRGGGLEVAIGMDYLLDRRNSLFAEVGVGIVTLSRSNDLRQGSGLDPLPPDGWAEPNLKGLGHLIIGARIGL